MAEKSEEINYQRTFLSLVIFFQLFVVLVGILSEPRRSELQRRLTGVFAPYIRPLHLVPDSAKMQLTHGVDTDDDHYFEVDLPGGKTVRLPGDEGSRWQSGRRRMFRLGRTMALFVEGQDDTAAAEVAIGVASSVMLPNEAKSAVVRLVQMQSQPLQLDRLLPGMPKDDPTAKAYHRVLYTADILFDPVDGTYSAAKRATRGEVAPTTKGAGQ